jgi:hypothetical protein
MMLKRDSWSRLWLLVLAATVTEAWLVFLGFNQPGMPMGDLTLAYEPWFEQVVQGHVMLGINTAWVYPLVALLPILLAGALGVQSYVTGWLVLQFFTLLAVLICLVRIGRPTAQALQTRYRAGYFWILTLVLLGPVAISRIDFFSVAVAVLATLFVAQNERVAAALLTVAGWIKIWPIAIFAAVFIASARRRLIFITGATISLVLLGLGYLLGGNANLFGFITGQLNRAIQIESPWASWWLWKHIFGDASGGISYNAPLKTFEVFGPGTDVIALLLGPGQLLAVGITVALGFLARRAKAASTDVLVWVSTTAVLDLIFFNKVGSPQFMTWLAVPLILALISGAQNLRPMLYMVASLSLLTWVVYPSTYDELLAGGFTATALLTARNLVLLVALVYANIRLTRLTKPAQAFAA